MKSADCYIPSFRDIKALRHRAQFGGKTASLVELDDEPGGLVAYVAWHWRCSSEWVSAAAGGEYRIGRERWLSQEVLR